MKNKILVIFMALALTLPVYSTQEEEPLPVSETQAQETVVNEPDNTTETIQEPEQKEINNALRKPTSKRKIAKKFLLAMLGVIISSTLIFALLSIYNKLRENFKVEIKNPKEEPSSLETPDNLNDAVKSFLDRTNWDN